MKRNNISVKDIAYVLAAHYHPDHIGLVGELMVQGVKLLLVDVQKRFVNYSDRIFERDKLPYVTIDGGKATTVSCDDSRVFLAGLGIHIGSNGKTDNFYEIILV